MGEEKCKSQKKKKMISVGEEKCKRKRKRKKIKIKSSLELLVKEKDVTKLVRMKQRLNMNI